MYTGLGVSVSFSKASSIAGLVNSAANYKREVLNGSVVAINLDGSYNVYIRSNGTTVYGVGRTNTSRTYSIKDNVLLIRKEGGREMLQIDGLSGYNSSNTYEEVDIA